MAIYNRKCNSFCRRTNSKDREFGDTLSKAVCFIVLCSVSNVCLPVFDWLVVVKGMIKDGGVVIVLASPCT